MNILVVAAHPDDEILGAGAAIARHADEGDQVHVLILAAGLDSRPLTSSANAHALLKEQAHRALKIVGGRSIAFADFPDNALDTVPLLAVVKQVEAAIAQHHPHTVYTHWSGDLNIDHTITARAVMTACRPLPNATVRRILSFEVTSATGWDANAIPFRPTIFLNATNTLDRKLKALSQYEGEMRPFPHARSLEGVTARARAWGAQVGLAAAEPFELIREVA
jgi:LmbE family N-acetylglucosaminyl deacetylase